MTVPGDSAANGPTSTGLAPNVAGALAYLFGPITGVLFYILEKDNRFVRFHAAQSIAISIAVFIISIAFGMVAALIAIIPIIGWLISVVVTFGLSIGSFVLWLFLMWQAFQGLEWEAPIAGTWARKMSS